MQTAIVRRSYEASQSLETCWVGVRNRRSVPSQVTGTDKCRQQALGGLPAAKSGLCQGKPHWHVCWWSLARATRSRNKSHPTAAIKIEETALAAQSNGRPRPSATLLQTPLQGPNFKDDFLTTRGPSGSSGPSERPSALHTGLSSAVDGKSSNSEQCTAAVCGLA